MFGLFKPKTEVKLDNPANLGLRPVAKTLVVPGPLSGDLPQAAALAALDLIENGMIVGLGTGRAASHFIRALAAAGKTVRCVPTSAASEELALSLGLKLLALDAVEAIDVTVDGADEIAPDLSVIKGGGGALLREKLVWAISERCVVVADSAKAVNTFGPFPLPVEVAPFLHQTTAERIEDVLADNDVDAKLALRRRDGDVFRTDGGNFIYDIQWRGVSVETAFHIGDELKQQLGVVETGVFVEMAQDAFIASPDGVSHVRLDDSEGGGVDLTAW